MVTSLHLYARSILQRIQQYASADMEGAYNMCTLGLPFVNLELLTYLYPGIYQPPYQLIKHF